MDRCPICRDAGAEAWRASRDCSLSRCRKCGFAWVPHPNFDSARQYVEDRTSPTSYYRAAETVDLVTFDHRLQRLGVDVAGRILDVGCTVGTFLIAARHRQWSAVGIEPNPRAAAIARARGFEVHEGFFQDGTTAGLGPFDAVHLGDVLEHVVDPIAFLNRARTVLQPHGKILVVTPDIGTLFGRLLQVKPQEHLVYFTARALRHALEAAGFANVTIERSGRRRSIVALRHSTTFGTAAQPWLRMLAVPGLRHAAEWTIETVIRDELLAVAEAPAGTHR
jgi:SAM-dependent methyltransferase